MLATRSARWTAGAALACVVIMVAAWFALVAPRREEADAVRAQALLTATEADQLQVKIAQLKAQYAELPLRKAELAGILKQMPPTTQMPDLVRSLNTMAEASGAELVSVAPSSPAYLTVAPTAAGVAAVTAGPAGTTSSSAAGTTTTGTTVTATKVISTPVVVTVTGEFLQTVTYLQKLQTQAPRAFMVMSLQVAPEAAPTGLVVPRKDQVRMVISGRVFSLPPDESATSTSTGRGTAAAGTTATTPPATTPTTGSTPAIAAGRDGIPAAPPVSRIGNADSHGQVTS
jgi:Pilus assembly protein, PilO